MGTPTIMGAGLPAFLEYKTALSGAPRELVEPDAPMEFKTAVLTAPPGTVLRPSDVSADAHEVTAVIAVTGVLDEVGDVIVPGAFADTLRERPRPKVCLGHDWNRPIGKTKWIKELLPGDPGLPPTTYDGKAWPAEAGAVLARYVPDMSTPDGNNAYHSAKFFGPEESTFSFGYKTQNSERRNGRRYLKKLAVYEYGPVLNPANRLATLQEIKTDEPDSLESKVKQVRDVAYWGEPYGSPIGEHTHPHGPKARAERRAGRVPSRSVGIMEPGHAPPVAPKISTADRAAEIEHTGLFPEPASAARALPGPRATGADQQHIDALAGHIRDGLAEPEADDEDRAAVDKAVRGLLTEAITPNEVHDRLAAHPEITAGADAHNEAVDRVGRDYAARYGALAAEQQRVRTQAGTPLPPERFTGMTNTQLRGHENASQQILSDLTTSGVGHDEPSAQLASANIQGAQHEMALRARAAREHPAVLKAHAQGEALFRKNPAQAATRADAMQSVLEELHRQQAVKPPPQGSRAERMPHQIQAMMRGLRGVSGGSKETPLPSTNRAEPASVESMPEEPAKPARRILSDFSDAELAKEKDKAAHTVFIHAQRPDGARARKRLAAIQVERDRRNDAARRSVPAHSLAPADYQAAQDHALNTRFAQQEMTRQNDQVDKHNARITSAEQTAASAPATIDHAPEGTEIVGGGRLLLANGTTNSWSLRSADNKHLLGADDFATLKGGKAKLSRAKINDLADHVAGIRDSNGNRVPFTAPNSADWAPGFRDEHGNNLVGASALAVRDWTGRNGVGVHKNSRFARNVTPAGGRLSRTDKPDADGFYPRQPIGNARPGDEVTTPDGHVKTVVRTSRAEHTHDTRGNYVQPSHRTSTTTLHFGDDTSHSEQRNDYGGRGTIGIRYANGASPMDASRAADPGMGFTSASNIGSRPGSIDTPSAKKFDQEAATALRNTPAPGTRFTEARSEGQDYKDQRPKVGTITDRVGQVQGAPARVVEYDDGTFDAMTPAGLGKINASPSEDEVNEARSAWGLPRTGSDHATEAARAATEAAAPDRAEPRRVAPSEVPTPKTPNVPEIGAPAETHANALARMNDRQAREHIATLPHSTLSGIDQVMAHRASALGKPDVVTAKHQMVRDAIPAASGSAVVTGPMQDEMAQARSEVLGLHELPDGHLEVEPEVGARQDRVAKLLTEHEAGALDLKSRSTEDLHQHHRDLSNELRLQQEIARRDAVHPPKRVSVATTQAGTPRVRPGLAGAAQDHAEALRSEDAAAINRTRQRLESALRRSRANSDTAHTLAQHVDAGHAHASTLDSLAGSLRAESRQKRNDAARKRTTAKRLDRERITSVLGSVNSELRSRGESPEVAKELGAPRTANTPETPLMSEGPVLREVVGGPGAVRQVASEEPKAEPVATANNANVSHVLHSVPSWDSIKESAGTQPEGPPMATAAQVRYATKLQADLRERITWPLDRDILARALRPPTANMLANPEDRAAARAAIEAYDPNAAIDAWIARRADLADTDLATLDGTQMSAWIDAVKKSL